MERLFGTNGIRGVFGETLTIEMIENISLSLAKYFEKGTVLVGYDGRHNNKKILDTVCSSFNRQGFDVLVSGLVPTPCLEYGTKKLNVQLGVMITASHNPPQYNGLKIVDSNGVEISRNAEKEIEKIYYEKSWEIDSVTSGQTKDSVDIIRLYIDGIKSLVNVDKINSSNICLC